MIVKKAWGYEHWIENNEKYCIKVLFCQDGVWSSEGDYHYHPVKDETFFILEGRLELNLSGVLFILEPGDARRIYPGVRHRFRNHGELPCKFIEGSTHHDDKDTVRIGGLSTDL